MSKVDQPVAVPEVNQEKEDLKKAMNDLEEKVKSVMSAKKKAVEEYKKAEQEDAEKAAELSKQLEAEKNDGPATRDFVKKLMQKTQESIVSEIGSAVDSTLRKAMSGKSDDKKVDIVEPKETATKIEKAEPE